MIAPCDIRAAGRSGRSGRSGRAQALQVKLLDAAGLYVVQESFRGRERNAALRRARALSQAGGTAVFFGDGEAMVFRLGELVFSSGAVVQLDLLWCEPHGPHGPGKTFNRRDAMSAER